MSDVADLTARLAITDVIARYFRGIDRFDMHAVEACFHPDAHDDHGTGDRTVPEFLEWVARLLQKYDATFHLMGQVILEIDDDTARSETYGVAHHRAAGGADHLNLVTGFRNLDRWERRAGSWRIVHRLAVTDWSRIDHEASWWMTPDHLASGARGEADPSFSLFGGAT